MKFFRFLGAMLVISSALTSCAPQYGCYTSTDSVIEAPATDTPVAALEVCP